MMDEQVHRSARIAKALQIRLDAIEAEMHSALRQRDDAYQLADALLTDFDLAARERYRLMRALWKVEQRLSDAAFDRQRRRVAA